jgi:cell wall assembly regulator SMI1
VDTIEGLWQRIEAWMPLHAPQLWHQLAPGADEAKIKHLESILDITLPEDVRASYRLHNGGYEIKLVSHMKILPVEGIIYHWQILRELLDDDDWASQPPIISRTRSCFARAGNPDRFSPCGGTRVGFPLGPIALAISVAWT